MIDSLGGEKKERHFFGGAFFIYNFYFFLYYKSMADGIEIEAFNIRSGLDDFNLENVFYGGSVGEVLSKFGQTLMGDLRESIDRKGMNFMAELQQSLQVTPNVIETDEYIFYTLEIPKHGIFQNEGVSGAGTPPDYKGKAGTVVNAPRFGFKQSSKPPFGALVKWARNKFGLTVPSGMTPEQFGFAAAYRRKYFGIKPKYWLDEVINDGRMEKLQEELGKRIGVFISEEFTK